MPTETKAQLNRRFYQDQVDLANSSESLNRNNLLIESGNGTSGIIFEQRQKRQLAQEKNERTALAKELKINRLLIETANQIAQGKNENRCQSIENRYEKVFWNFNKIESPSF